MHKDGRSFILANIQVSFSLTCHACGNEDGSERIEKGLSICISNNKKLA